MTETKHEGLPVAGYQPQSSFKVRAVNRNKEAEERVLRIFDELKMWPDVDGRWLAVARTHLEQAFMAANRAVFQPIRIKLPEDEA